MDFILKPVVLLLNQLRFKSKFTLLALAFYLPFLACCLWIIHEQYLEIGQYQE